MHIYMLSSNFKEDIPNINYLISKSMQFKLLSLNDN